MNVFRYSIPGPETERTEQRICVDIALARPAALDIRISHYSIYVTIYLNTIRAVVIDNRVGDCRFVTGNAAQAICSDSTISDCQNAVGNTILAVFSDKTIGYRSVIVSYLSSCSVFSHLDTRAIVQGNFAVYDCRITSVLYFYSGPSVACDKAFKNCR